MQGRELLYRWRNFMESHEQCTRLRYFHNRKGESSFGSSRNAEDARLMERIQTGDQEAMALVYDQYSGTVYAAALQVLRQPTTAEDVLQEVFMHLWRSPGSFEWSRGSLRVWLAVSSRHRAIDVLRRKRSEVETTELAVIVEPDMFDEAAHGEDMNRLRVVLNDIPRPQRSVLELAYFEGLSHTEIACKLGEPLGTIKTRIRGGLTALRKAWHNCPRTRFMMSR